MSQFFDLDLWLLYGIVSPVIQLIERLATEVYADLGSGHAEAVYQKAMEVALRLEGIRYEAQKGIPVEYKGHFVGWGVADIVTDSVVLEIKAVSTKVGEAEVAQVKKYMRHLNLDGMIVNFGQPSVSRSGSLEGVTLSEMRIVLTHSHL